MILSIDIINEGKRKDSSEWKKKKFYLIELSEKVIAIRLNLNDFKKKGRKQVKLL